MHVRCRIGLRLRCRRRGIVLAMGLEIGILPRMLVCWSVCASILWSIEATVEASVNVFISSTGFVHSEMVRRGGEETQGQ